jgi:myosin protein heavy chain
MENSTPVKRAASPSVEVSVKRTKRVHIEEHIEEDDHTEQRVEEHVEEQQEGERVEEHDEDMDEVQVAHSQPTDTITLATPAENVRRARRRFSEPLGANDGGLNTPTHSVRQMKYAQARRARMSMPAQVHRSQPEEMEGVREIQYIPLKQTLDMHLKRRLRRNHLSEEMNEIEDQKKREGRLKRTLAQLTKELNEKKEIIQQLEFQLESSRLGNIEMSDDQTAELQQQLDAAQQELEEIRNSSVYVPDTGEINTLAPSDDYDDDDDLVLADPQDLGVSQDDMRTTPLSNGYYATRAVEASQVTIDSLSNFEETTLDRAVDNSVDGSVDIPADDSSVAPSRMADRISATSKQRYEAEIESLMHRLADQQGAVRCLTIELQNLDIIAAPATAAQILTALRGVLEDSRQKYEALFNVSTADLNNKDFIRKLVQELAEMNAELLDKVNVGNALKQRVKLLETQYEGTMTLLAEETKQNDDLRREKDELITLSAEQKLQMEHLMTSLDREAERVKEQDGKIDEQNTTINSMTELLEDKNRNIAAITTALDEYRKEVESLKNTISRLEEEHADEIAKLQEEHTAVVGNLQTDLEAEREAREDAEQDAAQKSDYIEELEGRIAELDSQTDEVSQKVSELRERLDEEMAARAAAEEERNEHADTLGERAEQIQELEEGLSELQSEMEMVKMNLVAERTQRQKTEADLEEAEVKIEKLNDQLHHQGLAANELRSKLFQVQQERERVEAELNERIEAQDAEYDQLVGEKEKLREEAEERISGLDAKINELTEELVATQNALDTLQSAKDALEVERDEQLQNLNRQLEELRNKYTALQTSSSMQIDTLQATITDLTNDNNNLRQQKEDLEQTVEESTNAHAAEVLEKNGAIAILEEELAAKDTKISQLEEKNLSLEKRVEGEACELLNIMSAHAEEVNHLKRAINYHEENIRNLKATAEETEAQYTADIAEKERQIEELTIANEARGATVLELQAQVDELKASFKAQAEDSQRTIEELLDANRHALARQEEIALANKKRTQETLEAIAEMKTAKVEIRTHGVDLNKVIGGKVTKVNDRVKVSKSRKKKTVAGRSIRDRPRDSGFVELQEDEEGVEREPSDEGILA